MAHRYIWPLIRNASRSRLLVAYPDVMLDISVASYKKQFNFSHSTDNKPAVILSTAYPSSNLYYGVYAKRLLQTGNAGGFNSGSIHSEMLAMEETGCWFALADVKLEEELRYLCNSNPKFDFVAYLYNGPCIGVETTRIFDYYGGVLTNLRAMEQLKHKLDDLVCSKKTIRNVRLDKVILNVQVKSGRDAATVHREAKILVKNYPSTMVRICTVYDERIFSGGKRELQYLRSTLAQLSDSRVAEMRQKPMCALYQTRGDAPYMGIHIPKRTFLTYRQWWRQQRQFYLQQQR